jgi:hypothetical protein
MGKRPVPAGSCAEQAAAADALQRPLRFRFQARLSASVRRQQRQGKNQENTPREGTEGESMQTRMAVVLLFLAALCLAVSVEAHITGLTIQRVASFADGMAFGDVGPYERVVGTATGELDPTDARNKGIVNLDKAPRNAQGKVEYAVDVFLLRPVDPQKGNGKILYDVTNRGRKLLLLLMDAPAQNDPASAKDAGNGLVFRQGYTIVWSGWDPDAPKADNGMAMQSPVAGQSGAPIVRVIRDELVSGTRGAPVETFRLSYEAATLDQAQAQLTVRRKESDPRRELPASQWAYVDARTIRLLPEGTTPEPGSLYEFHYPAKDPKVLGIGFAATRDLVSFLRYGTSTATAPASPSGRAMKTALAIGISQSGRFLRDFIVQGFNQDEARRKVFDGVLAYIAGIGGVFLNHEFAQPFRTNTQHEDHAYPENAFPFSTATVTDPITGQTASLLHNDGFDPLLIEVNTSTEYWQKGASLLHTDPLGARDVVRPDTTRVYMVAGTQHGGRMGLPTTPGPCVNPRNPHNPMPALRALLMALDQWVSDGIAPPPNQVPTIADGTLVSPATIGFPEIPGFQVAQHVNDIVAFGDWVHPKLEKSKSYRPLVARVDADGNEVAGIRLPDIAVPLATYTGWNLYKAPFPEGELCDRTGSYAAFVTTRAEREAKGDPRLSLEERYGSHAKYVANVRAAAAELVKARLLLPEDAEWYGQAATAEDIAKRFALR